MNTGLSAPLDGPVSMDIPFSAHSAAGVRDALATWLSRRGSARRVVDDARLIATELVGNAVRHASPLRNGTVLVRWKEEDSALVISVADGGGPTQPEQHDVTPDDVGGRGLWIVDALSSTWWVEQSHDVHAVHVRLALD